ncbi:MAG: hypothetical protein WAM82_12335 [Thermoanaerobaculia bacterium]
MFCPNCESEYRPGFYKCADCGAALVEALPQEEVPQVSRELVPAFSTSETSDLSFVASTLDAAGIPHVEELEHVTLIPKRTLTHVLVPEDRYKEAVRLLESQTQPNEPAGESWPNILAPEPSSFDLHTFARFVIIGGLVVLGFGALKFLLNLPVSYRSSGNGYLVEMGQQMAISDANLIRASKRDEAINWLVGGVIVTFLGFAASASTSSNSDFQPGYRGPGGKRPSRRVHGSRSEPD